MLDRWFLKHLSPEGRKFYWVGQFVGVAVLAVLLFGVLGMSMDEGINALFVGLVVTIVGWGFFCKGKWPKVDDPDELPDLRG